MNSAICASEACQHHLASVADQPKMRAVGYFESKAIGEAASLLDLRVPRPKTIGNDLLVEVRSISVNPVDTKQRKRASSPDGSALVLGWDVAGIVKEVGEEVQNFKVGDSVYYAGSITRSGGNSEFHLVDERIVSKKPESLSFGEAAAIPLTALTAYEALFEQLHLKAGSQNSGSILIIGGAGGVGSMAIQMAKLAGLKVITTASRSETIDWAKKMGADIVLDHRENLGTQLAQMGINEVEYIFNTASTSQYWEQMAALIKPFGKICSIVESAVPLDLTLLMKKSASFSWELMFTRSMFETADITRQSEILAQVANWIDQNKIQTTLVKEFSEINAENLREAHALLESGKSVGKIVLSGWKNAGHMQ